jgi:hypothetical protein
MLFQHMNVPAIYKRATAGAAAYTHLLVCTTDDSMPATRTPPVLRLGYMHEYYASS